MTLFGWLDLSDEHRNKVMMVIDMFKDQGVIDELGLGTIRDSISDLLFPGTSTIQTRAKYFLIVPYLIKEVESKQRYFGREFIRELERLEIGLINKFKPFSRGDGVIGKRNGNPTQKPSSIYWSGLKTFKILNFAGSLSDYSFYIKHHNEKLRKQKAQIVVESGNVHGDDSDLSFLHKNHLWSQLPYVDSEWKENLSIKLTYEEAEFLKEKIITSCPDSLFAYSLEYLGNKVIEYNSIEDFLEEQALPEKFQMIIQVASDFNFIMSGALIRYNYLIQRNREDGNIEATQNVWEKYWSSIKDFDWKRWDVKSLWRLCPRTNYLTRSFVELWIALVQQKNYNLKTGDKLIIDREFRLKGPKRSKLYDKAIAQKQENWTGVNVDEEHNVYYLSYRWATVRTLIKDILNGLQLHAEAE